MSKPRLLLIVAAVAIGWFLYDRQGFEGIKNLPLIGQTASRQSPPPDSQQLRIATFNLESFHQATLEHPSAMHLLVEILRRFDIVAVQGLPADAPHLAQQLIDHVNESNRQYHCLLGPPVGRDEPQRQFAFVFDQSTVEVDHGQAYTIKDPDDLLAHPPLVAWFRAKGPPADQAFTFSLVNVDVDPHHAAEELERLDDVFFSVRDDGREEDDVILLGTFQAPRDQLNDLGQLHGIMMAISEQATNIEQTSQLDNLVFQQPSTAEYRGRGGTFDFLRHHNLTLEQARLISSHLPVWGDFSALEQTGSASLTETSSVINLR